MISGVKVNPFKCRRCGKDAVVSVHQSDYSGNYYASSQCSDGHTEGVSWSDITAAIDDVQAYYEMPEQTVTDILKRKAIPPCFGKMGWRLRRKQEVPTIYGAIPQAGSVGDAFESVVNEAIAKAERHAIDLARCAECDRFDRCKVMSGLTVEDD